MFLEERLKYGQDRVVACPCLGVWFDGSTWLCPAKVCFQCFAVVADGHCCANGSADGGRARDVQAIHRKAKNISYDLGNTIVLGGTSGQ